MPKMQVQSLGLEDPLEKEMATYSSILAWEIPWTEEPVGLPSMGVPKESDPILRLNDNSLNINYFPLSLQSCCNNNNRNITIPWKWTSLDSEGSHDVDGRLISTPWWCFAAGVWVERVRALSGVSLFPLAQETSGKCLLIRALKT